MCLAAIINLLLRLPLPKNITNLHPINRQTWPLTTAGCHVIWQFATNAHFHLQLMQMCIWECSENMQQHDLYDLACMEFAWSGAQLIIKSCPWISRDCEVQPVLNIPACRLRITSIWVSTHSIVLPGTVQRGRSETGNATDPSKSSNFKMHRPSPACSRACCRTCSTDCIGVVLQRSHSYSYLPLAETFPLCFDGGEGKHKRLCLLSHSLPPSPSHWSFSGLLCNKDAKYKPRSSCTSSLFASGACISVQRAILQMHSVRSRR